MEPLEGIRVVELAVAVQGPAAGGLLADMGADVIKVEPPGGDANRWFRGFDNSLPAAVVGTQFIGVSYGKRSVCVDIHTEAGLELVDRLVDNADIFLSNYREPALKRIGMGYERLSERNPRLIYATANGFGPLGPARENRMSDQYAQARSGISGVTGTPDDPPLTPGAIIGDTGGAMALALGILTALAARHRDGLGQMVQTSSYGALLWMQSYEINHASVTGHPLHRSGSFHPVVPSVSGIYATADGGAFCIGFREDQSWREFCAFGGMPELGHDPRWSARERRDPFREQAVMEGVRDARPLIAEVMKARSTAEWEDFFELRPDGITAQRVFDYQDVLEDEQALVNGYIVEKDIPHTGRHKVVGLPVRMSRTPGTPKQLFAELGEHTAEVMRELGYDEAAIETVESHRAPPF